MSANSRISFKSVNFSTSKLSTSSIKITVCGFPQDKELILNVLSNILISTLKEHQGYGGYPYSGCGCNQGCGGYGNGYGYGGAIVLVLFILLVIVIGARAVDGNR
mgnify:CR=1 FL=1